MRSIIALSAAAFAGLAAGQTAPQQNYPYTINPETVLKTDRDAWCANQRSQCPLICLQQPGVTSMTTLDNECDPNALTYSCVCENNVSPNITQYSQTLPYYICTQFGTNCVKACGSDNLCASKCRSDHPCGAQVPFRGNTSIPSTSSVRPTASGSQTRPPVSGFGGAQATGTSSTGGAAPGTFAPSAGMTMAALLSSVFLGFAVLL
ncbi:hypothetical protein CC86DRAFT_283221 [Ophiobolus disseminans]|uniref:DUF7707 domain-containing protein n=1 Tax=Ophiobolus disseminans TaxID=1469910 RepID=A0A6A7ACZ4_9PLEO|nr:hypothetical protein CC86DRAFT_283221 [Ophiobolus disseminans]